MSSRSRNRPHPWITPDPRTRQQQAKEAGDASPVQLPLRAADRAYRYVYTKTGDYRRAGLVASAAEGLERAGGLAVLESARILTPRQVRRIKKKANTRLAHPRGTARTEYPGSTPSLATTDGLLPDSAEPTDNGNSRA